MSNGIWIGVDVGKQDFSAALAVEGVHVRDWARLPVQSFPFSEPGIRAFVDWVNAYARGDEILGICIESTGRLGWRWMETLGDTWVQVAMVNPARPKAFGASMGLREKTDRVDACVLALYGMSMRPQPTTLASPVLRELRECNRLFSVLSRDRQAYAKRLMDGPGSGMVRRELRTMIRNIESRMTKVQARMDELIANDIQLKQDVERITSIKGVGARTAYVLLAELGNLRTYTRNELASYAGLHPRQFESGTSVYKRPRLAKRGGGPVRKALFLCAMSARKHNPQMRNLFLRLTKNGKAPMAALGAIMRKLLLLARSLLVNNAKYNPDYS